jgi:hypothetical protein
MEVPVTPGREDGGLSKRRMVRMAARSGHGPEREQTYLQLRETGDWWRTVAQIFESDLEERGEIRPAFRETCGARLLEENLPRPLPNWRHVR